MGMAEDAKGCRQVKQAFFLDRDGTINFDRIYINSPELIELIPGAAKAVRKIKDYGYELIVVTNQSGVARGLIKPEVLPQVHCRLNELLEEAGSPRIDYFFVCPHHPDDACDCRKPKQGLVNQAVEKLALDVDECFFIGDSHVDVLCGKRAGCKTVLVRTGKGSGIEEKLQTATDLKNEPPDFVADNLLSAVDWALRSRSLRSM